jgi:glycosyltransferase involved in cell wall biosynthesis
MDEKKMKICMVTSHRPPYQSANAILPQILAEKLKKDGHDVSFIIPEKAIKKKSDCPGDFNYNIIYYQKKLSGILDILKLRSLVSFISIYKQVKPLLKDIQIVHIHSNGILHQVVTFAASRLKKPVILTHYGTEIWHYRKKTISFFDLFKYMNKQSEYVTYYSKYLMDHSFKVGIIPKNPVVIYPPAGDEFKMYNEIERKSLREELGIKAENVLVNVKRLHPLGGHEFLIKAMPSVLKRYPDTVLYICGSGDLIDQLEKLKNDLGLKDKVILLGMVDNDVIWKYYAVADLYVLTSVLEALPTVVVEALACGTPAIMTETPGGKELNDLFPGDITLVELREPDKTAEAIVKFLSDKRRIERLTKDVIEKLFRTQHIYKQYLNLYLKSLSDL